MKKLLIIFGLVWLMTSTPLQAVTVTVAWDPVVTNIDGTPSAGLSGYTIWQSQTSFFRNGVFISTMAAMADPAITQVVIPGTMSRGDTGNLTPSTTYYFRVTAFDHLGNHSAFNVDATGAQQELRLVAPLETAPKLVAPTLNLPPYLPINAEITASYKGTVPAAFFRWTFTQIAPGAPALGAKSNQAPAAAFNTNSPTASLSAAHLDLGTYIITVTANNGSGGASAPASATVTLVVADLSTARVYPNPWRSDRHPTRPITFDRLAANSEIKIFTTSGHHVRTLPISSTSVDWDLKNSKGDSVASGLYLYVITTDGAKKTGQVAIIK